MGLTLPGVLSPWPLTPRAPGLRAPPPPGRERPGGAENSSPVCLTSVPHNANARDYFYPKVHLNVSDNVFITA